MSSKLELDGFELVHAVPPDVAQTLEFGEDFDANYGLIEPEATVLVRAYSDDSDDRVLAEVQPRYIIMFEPSLDFVRRVEVYKKSTPGLGVRVYLMIYNLSSEEAKYLAGVRKEKDAFERIIKERGVCTRLARVYLEHWDTDPPPDIFSRCLIQYWRAVQLATQVMPLLRQSAPE